MTTGIRPRSPRAPDRLIASTLGELRIGKATAHGPLSVFPLFRDAPAPVRRYATLHEGLRDGTVRVTEVSHAGSVPTLALVNEGNTPVLLVDGDELVGAKQNRIVNITILAPAKHRLDIPVSCVEHGRWSYASPEFQVSDRTMGAAARRRKASDVTASMRSGSRAADQRRVWDDIATYARTTKSRSATGAMSDIFEQQRARIDAFVAATAPLAQQVGAVFAVGGRIEGMELFDHPDTLRQHLPKLVRSYALDALARESDPTTAGQDSDVRSFLHLVGTLEPERAPSVGLGDDLRFESTLVTGGALVADGRLVHLVAFRLGDGGARGRPGQDSHMLLAELLRSRHIDLHDGPPLRGQPSSIRNPALRDRIEGMLLGLMIGDALGNRSESMLPTVRAYEYGEIRDYLPNRHAGNRRVGTPSDDSQLALWTVESLLENDGLLPDALAAKFCSGPIFGIGSAVREFIHNHKDAGRPWHEAGARSAGNGALMRIAPVLIPHLRDPSPALWSDTVLAAAVTHNDRASIGSCVAYVSTLWELLGRDAAPEPSWWLEHFMSVLRLVEGESRYTSRVPGDGYVGPLWRFLGERIPPAFARGLEARTAGDSWYSGAYLLETVPSVLYILMRHGHDPEEAIVRAVNDTRDNDSVGAIVGAAVGALHGRSSLPSRWIDGLLGRTREDDDGHAFDLIGQAVERWVSR